MENAMSDLFHMVLTVIVVLVIIYQLFFQKPRQEKKDLDEDESK